jgi:toxin ParE1/3/4
VAFRVTALAERDLADIGDYIALENRTRATSFIAEIEARFAEIAAHPGIYRLRDEVLPDIRAANHGRYLIYFRCEAKGDVVFLRVLHSARDQAGILAGKGENPGAPPVKT